MELPTLQTLARRIHVLRGLRVMLDSDLATLYGVRTKELNKAVKRNFDRFPEDFMFELTPEEEKSLRFQLGTSNLGRGGRRYAPRVFTERGVAMLSGVLQSPRAVKVNVAIMRTFVKLRELVSTHRDLAGRLDELEQKYDGQFATVFSAIRRLLSPSRRLKKRIGFRPRGDPPP